MRNNTQPTIPNKYNLSPATIPHLQVDRSLVSEDTGFWRNEAIKAWCLSGSTIRSDADWEFGTYNDYWLAVYDTDAPIYANKIRVSFSSHGGMCYYEFKEFYDFKDIENEDDLEIQEIFLHKINDLIDIGVFHCPKIFTIRTKKRKKKERK